MASVWDLDDDGTFGRCERAKAWVHVSEVNGRFPSRVFHVMSSMKEAHRLRRFYVTQPAKAIVDLLVFHLVLGVGVDSFDFAFKG